MRTFTEAKAKELFCPMMLNVPDLTQSVQCIGTRCVAFTEQSKYKNAVGELIENFYCAAMPGNR